MKNDYRDTSGRWLTQALFPETAGDNKYLRYRLRDGIGKKYQHLPVLKDLYMDLMDVTEYRFANKYLGGWEHWQRLLANKLIRREVDLWREELEVKMVAEGLLQITDIARDTEHKGRLTAAKFLAEKGFKPKDSVGRPSKKQLAAEKEQHMQVSDVVSNDLDRLRKLQ